MFVVLENLKSGLDSQGPATWLSDAQASALVERAMSASPVQVQSPAARRGVSPKIVAGAIGLFALGAAAMLTQRSAPSSAPVLTLKSSHVAPKIHVPPTLQSPAEAPKEQSPRPTSSDRLAPHARVPGAPQHRVDGASNTSDADLLKQANDLRRQGDFAGALELYQAVIRRYPSTMSGYVARVSAASMLSGKHPSRAVDLYQTARRQRANGALDLEIRQGLARAYRQLVDVAAERRELSEIVSRYPGTASAEHARERLKELAGN